MRSDGSPPRQRYFVCFELCLGFPSSGCGNSDIEQCTEKAGEQHMLIIIVIIIIIISQPRLQNEKRWLTA
jgi:hypothetical protein